MNDEQTQTQTPTTDDTLDDAIVRALLEPLPVDPQLVTDNLLVLSLARWLTAADDYASGYREPEAQALVDASLEPLELFGIDVQRWLQPLHAAKALADWAEAQRIATPEALARGEGGVSVYLRDDVRRAAQTAGRYALTALADQSLALARRMRRVSGAAVSA